MEGPRSKRYLNPHGGSTLSRISPLHLSNKSSARNYPKVSKHSNLVGNPRHSPTSKRSNILKLPIHLKRTAKMSSPKRSHSGDESDRPTKQRKAESVPALTGLEDCVVLTELSEKVEASEATTSDAVKYHLRVKGATFAVQRRREWSRKIEADWSRMPGTARKGLANLTGVLCYRNSLFQALLHFPQFTNWLLKYHKPDECVEDDPEVCVACKLRDLVQAYWTGRGEDVTKALMNVNMVFKANKWSASPASPNGQGDPEEHYAWILKVLSERLPTRVYRILESANHLVTDSCIKCDACGHISKTVGHVTGPVSIPLFPRIDHGVLNDYLNAYMEEVITGYKCEKCKDTKDKKRYQEVTHSPDILLIQLKRFNYSGAKDRHHVPISTNLSLQRHVAGTNKDRSEYELSAVVLHAGSSSSGHYICLARGGEGAWKKFDDRMTSNVSLLAALKEERKEGFTPYLLFFQRKRD